ncbi:MAG: M23 family metallopeptidase [Bacteroidales bacterium]|nr:M23 family metallopeptidase [Bacteroidales bacterium]
MSKKHTLFRFNEQTLNFEPYQAGLSRRIWRVVVYALWGILAGVAAFFLYSALFDSPDTRKLKEENDRLAMQYEVLRRQVKDIETVVQDLEERDDNMYRAILQAEPVNHRSLSDLGRTDRYSSWADLAWHDLVVNTSSQLDDLAHRVYIQSKSYDELADLVRNNEDRIAHLPAIQPVKNSVLRREASGYGWRTDPIYGDRRFHKGIDFSVPRGSEVFATADGTVSYIGYQRGGYGYLIIIDHGYGYETYYAHLTNNSAKVKVGQKVKRGDLIALSGHTGKSTAPHLHYEVRLHGNPNNPIYYFFIDLTPEEYDDMLTTLSNSGMPMD